MKILSARNVATAALSLLGTVTHATSSGAQVRPTTHDTTTKHSGATPAASGMAGMMAGPHHALAIAYGESLATFARALNADASRSSIVNLELAKPATAEMRRSLDSMKVHHQAQMSTVGTTMRMPMTKDSAAAMSRPARRDSAMAMPMPMPAPRRPDAAPAMKMNDMQTQMTTVETHLTMLETELNTTSPSAAKIIEHTAAILKVRERAMRMPSDSTANRDR